MPGQGRVLGHGALNAERHLAPVQIVMPQWLLADPDLEQTGADPFLDLRGILRQPDGPAGFTAGSGKLKIED